MDHNTHSSTDEPNHNQHSDAGDDHASSDNTKSPDRFSDVIKDAFKTGSEDAKQAFERAYPKAKTEISQGLHDLAYGIAYAGAFGSALLKEVTPAPVKQGFREGSSAVKRAAEEVVRQREDRATDSTEEQGSDPIPA